MRISWKHKSTLVIITLAVLVFACSKGGSDNNNNNNNGGGSGGTTLDCSTVPKTFSADVSPVIQSSCATNSGCHATGSTNGPGALTNYTQVFNARTAIRTAVANGTMPKTGSITTAQKNSILCWVDNGAPNN